MKSDSFARIIMRPLRAKKPAAGKTPLDINYGCLEDYVTHAAEDYEEKRQAFEAVTIEDPSFLRTVQKWQRSARVLAGWAGAWFTACSDDKDEQQTALDIFDRITKDSGIREKNIWKYVKQQKEALKAREETDQTAAEEELENEEENADLFTRSAILTQQHYTKLFENGGEAVDVEIAGEREAARLLEKQLTKIPRGKLWRQAIVFPPHRIPVNRPVPDRPDAYKRVMWMDPEDTVYDPVSGKLLPRPGYVSEDGLIDDKSVVFHPETKTVDIGYRGGERVTWNYVILEDPSKGHEPGSWYIEYLQRLYRQTLEEGKRGPFRRRNYEDDHSYNRIPDENRDQE